ncbi:glycosyltransferase family 4 protein [Sorangium sp. So ce131]|uniref:glycosyltransferase family 4 protein n=1 Tax=Sorangium sp. So ce131 TaxID=3133282 RepID=UPI003F643CA3
MADALANVASVLMTTDTVGGVFTYSIELARALAERGVQTTLAAMGGPLSPAQREAAGRVRGLALFESDFRLEWMDDPWADVERAGAWLLEIEEQVRPDVVHLNGYAHGALSFRAPKLVVAHSCVLSWWDAVLKQAAPSSYARYTHEVARGLAAAAAVVAPTRAMMRAVVQHYGAPRRALVIPNAADPAALRPARKEDVVLAVGRLWDQAKNIAALGEVAPHLPWPIRVAGSDAHPGGGSLRIDTLEHLGVLSAAGVAEALSRAAIYALPARYEPFGLSILEAALSGCALVLGDIPSLREVWGDAALFVAPDDTSALRRELKALIDDPARRVQMASRARARARLYTPGQMVQRYLELYRELLWQPRISAIWRSERPSETPAMEAEGRCA